MSIVYLSGLMRSGSTLLCNILNNHPEISSSTSSPLCHIIQGMKYKWSDDPFLLSQLDHDFDKVYNRLKRSTKAFVEAWVQDEETKIYIDKNRGWLGMVEFLRHLFPDFKMIVTLRDLKYIYASIEKRHRETLLLDFPDHLESNIVDNRAFNLFENNGLIASSLKALENLYDIPNILSHIYFWKYEDFIKNPDKTTSDLLSWIGVQDHKYDWNNIEQSLHESDSHYRFKYLHNIHNSLIEPDSLEVVKVSPRIVNTIENKFKWYYERYYPNTESSEEIEKELTEEIEKELNN
jgi:sulfotransferase